MGVFLQAVGAVLLAVVLILSLKHHGGELSSLLTLAVCVMGALAAMQILSPVVAFLESLRDIGGLDPDMVRTLLQAVGVGLLAEIAALVCSDTGNASLGKTVQLIGSAVILGLSLPLFQGLIALLQEILGGL